MEFVPAKWFTPVDHRDITLHVIHCMQIAEKPNTAEGCAQYFRRGEKKASAHYCHDNNSDVQCVEDMNVAYAAPGANHNGLHYELAGYAQQTADEWTDPYSLDTIHRAAVLVSAKCEKYKNPKVFLRASDLVAGRTSGITTHWEVTKAYHKSDHWDPGPNFPIEIFMQTVRGVESPVGDEVQPVAKRIPGTGYWPNGRAPFSILQPSGRFDVMNNLPGNPFGWFRGDYYREKDGTPRQTPIPHAPVCGFDYILNAKNEVVGYDILCIDGGTNTFK